MMRLEDFVDVLARLEHPQFRWTLVQKSGLTFLVVKPKDGKDSITGEPMDWNSRKWYLSPHSTRSEVVQTAFLALLTALEHEAREAFTYQGVQVMNPHRDLDHLVLVTSNREAPSDE